MMTSMNPLVLFFLGLLAVVSAAPVASDKREYPAVSCTYDVTPDDPSRATNVGTDVFHGKNIRRSSLRSDF